MVACSILICICSPLIASVFTTDQGSIHIFTAILCFIVLGLVPYSALHFVNKVFYAKENTKAIFVLYVKTAPIHILLMLILAVVVPKDFLIMSLVLASSAISWLRFAIQMKALKGLYLLHRVLCCEVSLGVACFGAVRSRDFCACLFGWSVFDLRMGL